jgi:hypothetical protein
MNWDMKKGYKIAGMIVLGIVGIGVFTYGTMLLWNWLIPDLFGGPLLTYWQTLGLLVLSKIFFSGFGGKGGKSHGRSRGYWKDRISTMSPEEREQFKIRMKDKWCRWEEKKKPVEPSGHATD